MITDPMLMAGIGVGLMFVPKFVRI